MLKSIIMDLAAKFKSLWRKPEFYLLLSLAIWEFFHVYTLFQGHEFVAGGDAYTYLQIGIKNFNALYWNSTKIALGGINPSVPDALGFPLYTRLLSFLSPSAIQHVLIYLLYFFRYVAFIKLAKLVSSKLSIVSIIPAIIMYSFSAFATLDPFSLFPLMFAIYLPVSLYYFIRLVDSQKLDLGVLIKLLILSVIFVPLNANIALAITIFIPQFLYLLFSLKTNKNVGRFKNVFLYYFFWLLINLWWIVPMLLYFYKTASGVFSGDFFSAITAGSLKQNFRFIGQWGWYEKYFMYNYYPFSFYYDNLFILLISYSLVAFSFLDFLKKKITKFRVFFLSMVILSLFLVGGSRQPFGFFYQLLYDNVFGFKIFREPFTKFGELYMLSTSILFYLALANLSGKLVGQKKGIVLLAVTVATLLSAKPALIGEHVWNSWNASMRTFRIDVPKYWREFSNYVSQNITDSRILSYPKVSYGGAWNWPDGFSSADDAAVNFVGETNSVLRFPLATNGSKAGEVINNIFNSPEITNNYLAILGIKYLLVENDFDWRYSGSLNNTPERSIAFTNNLGMQKLKDFGLFTQDYLNSIPNNDPNLSIKQDLIDNTLGKPALSLYKLDSKYILPEVYIPQKQIYTTGIAANLPELVKNSTTPRLAVYIDELDKTKSSFKTPELAGFANEIYLYPTRVEPKVSLNFTGADDAWFWPELNSRSIASREFSLVKLKEFSELALAFQPLQKLDKYIWYATERMAVIHQYSNIPIARKTIMINDFIYQMRTALKTAKSVPEKSRDDRYWGLISRMVSYYDKSLALIASQADFSLTEHPEILNLRTEIANFVISIDKKPCGEFCYLFKSPIPGDYSLYVDNTFVKKLVIRNASDIYESLDPDLYLESTNIDSWNTDGGTIIYSELQDLKRSRDYLVSFDYKTSYPRIVFTIAEEVSGLKTIELNRAGVVQRILDNFTLTGTSIPFVQGTKYCKYVENGECFTRYEQRFSFPEATQKAVIAFDLAGGAGNPIKNFKIQKVKANSVRLVKNVTEVPSNSVLPHLTFIKVDSTKFKVYVSGAKIPYTLILNNSYDKDWHIYLSNGEAPKKVSEVTSFFGDDIKQVSERGGFNIKSLFEVYGKPTVADSKHYTVNGYANAWLIDPKDTNDLSGYELIIEYKPQRFMYLTIGVAISAFLFLIACLVIKFYRKAKNES